MRRFAMISILTVCCGTLLPAAAETATLVDSCASPTTSGNGLTWDGTHLWLSDFDTRNALKIDPSDCSVVDQIPLPGSYPWGLGWDGTHLWHADATAETVYLLSPLDGSVVSSFPVSSPSFVTGLAFGRKHVWSADSFLGQIHEWSPQGDLLSTLEAPGTTSTGLAYDGSYLWHSDNVLDTIFLLDPTDVENHAASCGSLPVLFSFASPDTYPNGLAWDGEYLWIAGSGTEMLYKYSVPHCGDGSKADWEACDDGNRVDGDGCSSNCRVGGSTSPVAADFGEEGLWLHDDAGWTRMSPWNPENVISCCDGWAADFGTRGLWLSDESSWRRLTSWDPQEMACWSTDRLAVGFGVGRGLWLYDCLEPEWKPRLTTWDPVSLAAASSGLLADFGPGRGMWVYHLSGWTRMTSWHSEGMAVGSPP